MRSRTRQLIAAHHRQSLQRFHTRETILRNLPLSLILPTNKDLLIMMTLLRPLLDPIFRPLRSSPRKCPLIIHDHDFVDCKLNIEFDGGENAFVGFLERFLTHGGGKVGGHEDAVGGVEVQHGGERAGG